MFWRSWWSRDELDSVLLNWTRHDAFKVRDLLNGGIAILGRTGSGKTSSSGWLLASKIVTNRNSCGLVLAAKPEDAVMWQRIFAQAGRSKDLLTFDASGKLKFNFLAEAMRHGGHTREITRCIMTIGETLRSNGNRGRGEDSSFWEREQERMIYNAVQVVKLAQGTVSAPDLQSFISTAALGAEQLKQPDWQARPHCRWMQRAFDAKKSPVDAHDFQLAADYWLGEYPNMAERTRSSILTGVMGILHVFNTGLVRELVSGETNVSPDDMLLRRKWVLVNLPPATYGDIGRFINAGWKYLTQRRVLKRETQAGDAFHVCWCDEAHQFVNSFDAAYAAQSRSHLGCMVFLSQSLHSFYSNMAGESGKHEADALLANFGHRIIHALGDRETAEWASELLGKRLETFIGGSTQPPQDLFDSLMGCGQYSGSFSMHYEPVLQTNVFMNGLRTGGKAGVCDGIVMRSGEPFANGENWLQVEFSQKR